MPVQTHKHKLVLFNVPFNFLAERIRHTKRSGSIVTGLRTNNLKYVVIHETILVQNKPFSSYTITLTSAPLLKSIMKMMKLSNQLCSTIMKHVLLKFHHVFPLPSVMFTSQRGNLRTQADTNNYFVTGIFWRKCLGYNYGSLILVWSTVLSSAI